MHRKKFNRNNTLGSAAQWEVDREWQMILSENEFGNFPRGTEPPFCTGVLTYTDVLGARASSPLVRSSTFLPNKPGRILPGRST